MQSPPERTPVLEQQHASCIVSAGALWLLHGALSQLEMTATCAAASGTEAWHAHTEQRTQPATCSALLEGQVLRDCQAVGLQRVSSHLQAVAGLGKGKPGDNGTLWVLQLSNSTSGRRRESHEQCLTQQPPAILQIGAALGRRAGGCGAKRPSVGMHL